MITKEASKHSIRDFEVRSGGWYIQIAFLMPPPLKVIAVANVATVNGVVA